MLRVHPQPPQASRLRPDNVCSLRSMVKSVRASFLSAQKFGTRTRGRPLLSNAGRRARTPTLMPGRSLTRPCPGTGTPPSQFVSGLSACLSLQRARFHPPPRSNVAVAVHPSLRSNVFMRAVGVTTSPLRGSTGNSRFALAKGIESAACFQSFAPAGTVFRRAVRPASRRRRQSVLERQPRPASVRCAHHRGTGACARPPGPDSTT